MATLLFGGAFNPITHGHLLTAREAMERGGFNKVIFIPTGYEGYKGGIAAFEHHLAMLKLAIAGHDWFEISEWEGWRAKKGHKNYTIDTFRHFMDSNPDRDLWWLIGSDNLGAISGWKYSETIREEMKFVVLPRPGCAMDGLITMEAMALQGKVIHAPLLEISSTYVRNRVRQGRSIRYLVPDAVNDYMSANGLYGAEQSRDHFVASAPLWRNDLRLRG